MFDSCTHGFIAATCPHCKGGTVSVVDGDAEGSPLVDMNRIMDAAVDRLERTGLRQNRAEKAQISRRFR